MAARSRSVLALVLLVLFAANVVLTHNILTEPFPGLNDFLTPWEASRSYFYEGLNPYSEATSINIQEYIYGRPAAPDEFPNHFAYPFYATFVTWPLIHVDYAWASAIWLALSEVFLIASVVLILDLYGWRAGPLMTATLIFFTLLSYPGSRALLLGQVSNLVFLLHVLVLWALRRDRDLLAGVLLALSTFKPQMSLLLVPFLLLWALVDRRRVFIASFSLVLAALLALSFLLQPDWVAGFLYQLELYPTYVMVSTPVWVITQYVLGLGTGVELAVNLLLLVFMLWTWYTVVVARHSERFMWAVMVTLTITHLVLRTATPHFVVFMLLLVFYLQLLARHGRGRLIAVILLALFGLPWLYFLLTLGDGPFVRPGTFEHPTNFIFLPFLTLATLWFTRRYWWARAAIEEAPL